MSPRWGEDDGDRLEEGEEEDGKSFPILKEESEEAIYQMFV